jgi:hypothetical protein
VTVVGKYGDTTMDGWMITMGWLRICDDVDRLHVKIDNLNDSLVGFCFITSIDKDPPHRNYIIWP